MLSRVRLHPPPACLFHGTSGQSLLAVQIEVLVVLSFEPSEAGLVGASSVRA